VKQGLRQCTPEGRGSSIGAVAFIHRFGPRSIPTCIRHRRGLRGCYRRRRGREKQRTARKGGKAGSSFWGHSR